MTCIVGVSDGERVYMGADSLGSTAWTGDVFRTPKLFKRGPFLLGCCGDYRYTQLLMHAWDPPRPGKNIDKFVATELVDSIWHTLEAGGALHKSKGVGTTGGMCLLAYHGRVWRLEDNFGVIEPESGFTAMGSGEDLAMGSLHTTRGDRPKRRVRAALEAASAYDIHVGGPLHFKVSVA